MISRRSFLATAPAGAFLLGTQGTALADSAARVRTGDAPGAPGAEADWLPADKQGFGTSTTLGSKVWYTLEGGALSDVYYPDLSTPSVRSLQLAVSDGESFAVRERDATTHEIERVGDSLTYRQVNTDKEGRFRITKTYVADPERSAVLVDLTFESLTGRPYRVYALHDPGLSNDGNDDTGRSAGDALVAADGETASALMATPGLARRSSGYRGTSDGWTDLSEDNDLDRHYRSASEPGNVVQVARLPLDGVGRTEATLALGFGKTGAAAKETARVALKGGFDAAAEAYAQGWRAYLAGLKEPPASLLTPLERETYTVSAMVLAAHEDKTYRGAFVASPSMPWSWGFNDELAGPTGPYHLVWPRDQYQVGTALLAIGDRAGAERSLDYMFDYQQQADGHLSQNTKVDGTPYWTSIQLDETADPIILAWQLGRDDARTWEHVRQAAEFILTFSKDGHQAPWTEQERWEEQDGFSPATIAAEIAALVCAADIARVNGDGEAARRYLDTADRWQVEVDEWTITTTGPYTPKPYYLRLTKDGNPDAGTKFDLGNSSYTGVDQRKVVDQSFLELVRLGVKPADDPVIRNTLQVVDDQLSVVTPHGRYWHRYSWDGYGEQRDGGPWNIGFPPGSRTTLGRVWPLLSGERGEYELLTGKPAHDRLRAIALATSPGGMLSEQVWDGKPPTGEAGFAPGEGTFSATPLAWTHAQFVRLAWSIEAGEPVERPSVVADRYVR